MIDKERIEYLESHGFILCDETGECDECGNIRKYLFFHRTNPEILEGNYYCQYCAIDILEEEIKRYKEKSMNIQDLHEVAKKLYEKEGHVILAGIKDDTHYFTCALCAVNSRQRINPVTAFRICQKENFYDSTMDKRSFRICLW